METNKQLENAEMRIEGIKVAIKILEDRGRDGALDDAISVLQKFIDKVEKEPLDDDE